MIRTIAVLAGGLATRMGSRTRQRPKALLELAGRPFADHQLLLLRERGIRHVVFCVGYLGHQIEAHVGNGARFGVSVEYVYDGQILLGTGGAIRRALPLLGPSFFVMYGDSYLECDYQAVASALEASGRPALMTVFANGGRWDASNVIYRDGRILKYDKVRHDPAMSHIDYGLGAFRVGAFAAYGEAQRLDLSSVYQDLLAGGQLAAFEVTQRFYEIGSVDGLAETDTYLRSKDHTR
jgi:NDP-sugar pyrophosphorylase family protein